uniref:Nudix hydrolase domain-containing protein n=2 Tax=Meloidogyne incognita group TaxID=654580 RepID=A0A914MZZ1_MELIC
MSITTNCWIRSASVILLNIKQNKMLILQRGSTAKFMPNSFVFPGGIVDPLDFKFPIEKTNFDKLIKNQNSKINLGLKNDFYLRICAIREMFEESGILAITDKEGNKSKLLSAAKDENLSEWRKKILSNPNLFHEIFSVNMKIDIASLIPWANWLTPFGEYSKRYDTAFFVLITEDCPESIFCINEMMNSFWIKPSEINEKSVKGEVSLPPPQFYELERLQLVLKTEKENLNKFTNTTKITPHIFKIKEEQNIHLYILPEDYLYDNLNPNFKPTNILPSNELLLPPYLEDKQIHRIITHSTPPYLFYHGHKLFIQKINKNFKH